MATNGYQFVVVRDDVPDTEEGHDVLSVWCLAGIPVPDVGESIVVERRPDTPDLRGGYRSDEVVTLETYRVIRREWEFQPRPDGEWAIYIALFVVLVGVDA
jgi:hypothetical protein